MSNEIELRINELTHELNKKLLYKHLNQIKCLMPLFISSIKVKLLIINQQQHELTSNIKSNCKYYVEQTKSYLIKRISYELNEIINILKLTTNKDDINLNNSELTIVKQTFVNNFDFDF